MTQNKTEGSVLDDNSNRSLDTAVLLDLYRKFKVPFLMVQFNLILRQLVDKIYRGDLEI